VRRIIRPYKIFLDLGLLLWARPCFVPNRVPGLVVPYPAQVHLTLPTSIQSKAAVFFTPLEMCYRVWFFADAATATGRGGTTVKIDEDARVTYKTAIIINITVFKPNRSELVEGALENESHAISPW